MIIEESNIRFAFSDEIHAIKFDDDIFYRNCFNSLPGGKGVDIIANGRNAIQLIEIKNCSGNETSNIWRLGINNSCINSAPRDLNIEAKNSLDIEMAQKVASTCSCLYGAWTKSEHMLKTSELIPYWDGITDKKILKDSKRIEVILFLEGDFDSKGPRSRSKKMIMQSLRGSIRKMLSWLNCDVVVVDLNTYSDRYFTAEAIMP